MLLGGIYFFFQPLNVKEQESKEVPLLALNTFTLYELDTKGLKTIMAGDKALRFTNRYTVDAIDFTDNAKEFVSNMTADHGVYKNDIVHLRSNIVYVREDGLSFKTESMLYNRKTSIAKTTDPYIAYKGESTVVGKGLEYNAKKKILDSKSVTVRYKLKEER